MIVLIGGDFLRQRADPIGVQARIMDIINTRSPEDEPLVPVHLRVVHSAAGILSAVEDVILKFPGVQKTFCIMLGDADASGWSVPMTGQEVWVRAVLHQINMEGTSGDLVLFKAPEPPAGTPGAYPSGLTPSTPEDGKKKIPTKAVRRYRKRVVPGIINHFAAMTGETFWLSVAKPFEIREWTSAFDVSAKDYIRMSEHMARAIASHIELELSEA